MFPKIDALDEQNGYTWMVRKTKVPPKARFKFYKENNNTMVKYNSLSLAKCMITSAK